MRPGSSKLQRKTTMEKKKKNTFMFCFNMCKQNYFGTSIQQMIMLVAIVLF